MVSPESSVRVSKNEAVTTSTASPRIQRCSDRSGGFMDRRFIILSNRSISAISVFHSGRILL